jgi:hypothetical protein
MGMDELKYVVIGAGPSGLAAARALQAAGLPYVGLEKHSGVGGLWDIENPHSTVYDSAHLISSKKMTEFNEFPMSEDTPDYPSHRHLRRYFQDYAAKFGLAEKYVFNAEVESMARAAGGGWDVVYGGGKKLRAKGVILATGTLHYPNMPSYEGSFTGEFLHSSRYKNPELFRGKRVLIVGAGNSGCDIAVDAVYHAKSVDMSLRRGYHFVPKYIFGRPADTMGTLRIPSVIKKFVQKRILAFVMGDPSRLGFPKPDHQLFESHPIVNSLVVYHAGHGDLGVKPDISRLEGKTVHFKDGSSSEYDVIVYATGYKQKFPFIDHAELNWQGACPKLYLNVFHPQREDLFVVGMVEALGIGWQGRYEQAELVAQFLKAQETKAPGLEAFLRRKRENKADLSGGMNYIKLDRMAYYVHKDTYLEAVRSERAALETA